MKKLLVVLMVLAFVGPAMADDVLDASGSMRVEVYSISNRDFTDDDGQDHDYWDQRFRMQLRFKPADGVSATVRTDITEATWGSLQGAGTRDGGFRPGLSIDADTGDTSAGGANNIIMVDRAYLSVDKGLVNINAGLNTFNLGHGIAYNNQGHGVQITIKTPLVIRLGFTKESENGGLSDNDDLNTEDTDSYFVDLGFKNDMMSLNLFYGAFVDGRDGDQYEPNVFGALYKGKVGPVNILAELDIFGGTQETTGNDLIGTQFFGDVSLKLNDMVTVGSHLIYAAGSDEADEEVITNVVTFADVIYQDAILPQNGPGSLQPLGLGFSVGANQGAVGLGPYAKFKVMDELTLAAHIIWLNQSSEGPDPATEIDSVLFYGVGASWALAPKTNLDFGYTAANLSEGDSFVGSPEDYSAFGAILSVSF